MGAKDLSIDSTRRSAREIYDEVTQSGRDELERSTQALIFSGLVGGVTMGLTPLAAATVTALLPPSPAAEFVARLFYPIGFVAVIIGRSQLFTENTLYPIALVLKERRHFGSTLRLWGTVFAANVAGAFLFALLAVRTTALQPKVAEELVKLGVAAAPGTGFGLFWSGVIGGWIIALVAWMVSASHWTVGQIIVVWLLTFIVGAGHFAHCIATSCEILAAVVGGEVPARIYLHWLLFATAGNIAGGVSIVTILNWGQVHAGEEE